MSMSDIIQYVLNTPENSNANVLRGMIEAILNTLSDMSDVAISNPTDGQVLLYSTENNKWTNSNVFD